MRMRRKTLAGEYLRAARRASQVTQVELARVIGVHHTLVSQWELGRTLLHPTHLADLVDYLGLDMTTLRTYVGLDLIERIEKRSN